MGILDKFFKKPIKKKTYTLQQLINFINNGDFVVNEKIAFQKNLYVYRCVSFVAEKSAEIPIYLKNKKTEEYIETELLKKPNQEQNISEFTEQVAGCLELYGNCFIYKVQVDEFIELHILNPELVTVVHNFLGSIIGYEYSGYTSKYNYTKDEVLHLKKLDFFNQNKKAISPILPLEQKIKTEQSIETWNENTFKENLRPSAIITTNETLSDDEFKRVKKNINDTIGTYNNRKPLFIDGGEFDYKQISINPSELDFMNAKKMNREDICVAFGVPPILLGLMDKASYNNLSESRVIFFENKIIPFMEKFTKALTEFIYPNGEYYFYYDLQKTPVFAEMRAKKAEEAKSYFAMGVPFDVINDHLELGFPEFEKSDVGYLPMGLTPTYMKTKSVLQNKYLNLKTPEAREMQKKFMDTEFTKIENINKKIVKSGFDEAIKSINPEELSANYENDFTQIFEKTAKALIENTVYYFGKQLETTINQAELKIKRFEYQYNFDMFDPIINSFITDEAIRQAGLWNTSTNVRMKQVITAGFKDGLSIYEISEKLKDDFIFSSARAERIARTETTSCANFGLEQSAKQSTLIEKKEWLSAKDELVRESHIFVDGEKIGLDDSFSNGLTRPGDPEASADEIVNCRCSLAFDI